MSIRAMEKRDIERISELERELFSSPWSQEDLLYEIENNPFAQYYILEKDKIVIGYIGLWFIDEQCQITTVGVAKNFQRHGYASQLLDFVFEKGKEYGCTNVNLEVRVSNHKAIALYEKYGFQNVTVRKDYYADHEDAYLMIREREG